MNFSARRCVRGTSDPVGLQCSCSSGSVILFYEYSTVSDPGTTAADLRKFCLELDLYGKVRIATEGVNVTLGGSTSAIEKFRAGVSSVLPLLQHIDPMDDAFFKPGQGCKHCFTDLSVKIVDEICPFGGRNPLSMRTDTGKEGIGPRITGLTPQKFHQELSNLADDKDTIVIDVRNYYESRIGFFENAVRPAIRRFSSFADWVDENCDTLAGKRIFTYCTGGIRCEKGAAYILDKVGSEVYMLDGGIHAYLEWAAKETSQPCLFKGANYVFDARVTTPSLTAPVAECNTCGCSTDRYAKCSQENCHLMVVSCENCQKGRVVCCQECGDRGPGEKMICSCERERRRKLLHFNPNP